ncbi:ABC transporter substrate-binding protein [uncultured Shewanella sp.]|uniref:substrate-binding periplasmic protein n=1 Tax=Shewanella atlantica TaxID=271099 RepID=UPI002616F5E0|nr:ABC transporter substrate-binding protein [uncultured Shewanella sp.]
MRLIMVFILSLPLICSVDARELVIASSEGPPHMIDDTHHGIDLDIVEAVLRRLGHDVSYEFMGLKRAHRELKLGRVDVTAPVFMQADSDGSYISDSIVLYQPMVFSLKASGLNPATIADLQGHSLLTFQGAPGYFGEEFEQVAKGNSYQELTDMGAIAELLTKGRYEYAVLDKYIFYYYYRLNDKRRDVSIFTEHKLIPPVPASSAFHDATLRDEFNRELKLFMESQEYKQIFERYLGSAQLTNELVEPDSDVDFRLN